METKTGGRSRTKKIDKPDTTPAKKAAAAPKRGQQQAKDAASAIGKQGDTTAGGASVELRGGAKQVLISEVAMNGRGGRPAGIEDYPFGELAPAHKTADGKIVGQSFFIPSSDRADGRLAAARKRHRDADGKPALFWSRRRREQVNGEGAEVDGLRIWRGTPELENIAKR